VAAFAARRRSAIYGDEADAHPLSTLNAFVNAAQHQPEAGRRWLSKLETITEAEVAIIMNNVPRERISDTAIEFASRLILINKNRLIEVGKDVR